MYSTFQAFSIRVPQNAFSLLQNSPFKEAVQNQQFQEAIYIASPILYTRLQKYITGGINNVVEQQKIEVSLYKYLSRMSTRCTPFGLFAGCAIGIIIGKNTKIALKESQRHTRLDMFCLSLLSQEIAKKIDVRESILYYPNTTLYPIGKKYRYVEYQFYNNRKSHQISAIERFGYLDAIIDMARGGVKFNEILTYLTENDIEQSNARELFESLIDSQIIVSELSPTVTGDDYFSRIIKVLESTNSDKNLLLSLKNIQELLYQLDSNRNENIERYQKITEILKGINIPFEEKSLFQVDTTKCVSTATLGNDIVNELYSTMAFLNKITNIGRNETLNQFQQAFHNRFEEKEMPLMDVLDPEMGIGYPVNTTSNDISPLLDNFFIPNQTEQGTYYLSNTFLSTLLKKVIEALKQDELEIILTDEDVKNFASNWDNLPSTMYSMFEILKSDSDNLLIRTNGYSGTCGANLIARFAHTDERIVDLIKEIAHKEQELMPEVILTEIAHLPDPRVGNILFRPHIRDYELLYLANSDLPEQQLIYISDLHLSVRCEKLYLRSKKLNREIVPRLTNAHNYRNNSLPVYRFLCDMQLQHGRSGLKFDWGYLKNELDFLPRVRYKNTILSLASWKIKTAEMKYLFSLKNDLQLLVEIKKWRERHSLPSRMLMPEGDNELFVDWDNAQSIKTLFSIIRKSNSITLTEYLYNPEHSVVNDENGNPYPNNCIVAFYKNQTQ